jgi:hypothetical protein
MYVNVEFPNETKIIQNVVNEDLMPREVRQTVLFELLHELLNKVSKVLIIDSSTPLIDFRNFSQTESIFSIAAMYVNVEFPNETKIIQNVVNHLSTICQIWFQLGQWYLRCPGTFTRLRSCIVPAEITEPPQN